ncbi:hypothetical protein [Haloferax volcanii]|uniref:hypothetical protein n=1 Tax=Haloferax volcanii TaxID=2246 RepID=UPI003D302F1C
MVSCSDCGTAVRVDSQYCRECGAEIVEEGSTEEALEVEIPVQASIDTGLPETNWHKGVIAATAGWIVVLFGATALPPSLFGLLALTSWILLPLSLYKDSKAIAGYSDWPKYKWAYIGSSALFILVAFIPGLVYLWKRRKAASAEGKVNVESSTDTEDESVDSLQQASEVESEYRDTTVEYDGSRFYCEYNDSPNRRWTIAQGRSYDADESRLFLYEDDELRFTKELETAQDSVVSDTGVVAAIDGLTREELSGKLYVYDSSGEAILTHLFNANVGACSLSNDARYVAVATFNPECYTRVFDAQQGGEILKHENLEGNKMGLDFREEKEGLLLYLGDGTESESLYAINLEGEVVWKSDELQRRERLRNLMDSSDTDDLEEALDLLDEAYNLAAGENEKKNVARKLADTHWNLSREIKREDGDTDAWWSHLNQAKEYYSEILPWYDGKQGVAKVSRKQGKYYLKQSQEDAALEMFQTIADFEDEYDVQLLTDADKRKLERLSGDSG